MPTPMSSLEPPLPPGGASCVYGGVVCVTGRCRMVVIGVVAMTLGARGVEDPLVVDDIMVVEVSMFNEPLAAETY